ncbi:MAG: hypothetical protein HGA22_07790, partial [Clostridiales bacterium]|nr:hypothetical protein [Clostridiales bacterium]
PVPALGTAVLTFVGQNVGAGNSGRVTKGIKAGLVMDVAYALLLIPVLLLGGRYFLGVFTNDQAVVEAGYKMLFTLAPFYWMMAIQNLLSNAFKGAGCATISVVISIFTCFFGRIVIGSILIWLLKDVVAVYYGIVSDFFLAMALNIIVFKVGKWRKTAYGERSISYRQEVLPEN